MFEAFVDDYYQQEYLHDLQTGRIAALIENYILAKIPENERQGRRAVTPDDLVIIKRVHHPGWVKTVKGWVRESDVWKDRVRATGT